MTLPSTATPQPLAHFVKNHLHHLRPQLLRLDLEALARQTGWLKRKTRKIPLPSLALGLLALAAETVLSLERVASAIGLAAKTSYAKQSLHQRPGPNLQRFLGQMAAALFGQLTQPLAQAGLLAPFPRVLLHDSTVQALPPALASAFPGPANQRRKRQASLKLQFICDLRHSQLLHLGLSGFRRNDQAAAADILPLVQRGDLVIRDLGYFVLQVLAALDRAGAFFLSRCRYGLLLVDPDSRRPVNLAKLLRPGQCLDRPVWVGTARLPLRLVALPVPEPLANQRRRQARHNRDRRLNPCCQRLYLLGWNIFLTNVPPRVWAPNVLARVYRLRWRMEMTFKAWKSHLRLRELNCRTAQMVSLSVFTKLLFCIAACQLCDSLELLGDHSRHVSLLRLARVLGHSPCWFAATLLGISPQAWLEHHLKTHAFYEVRRDRKNFYELANESGLFLT